MRKHDVGLNGCGSDGIERLEHVQRDSLRRAYDDERIPETEERVAVGRRSRDEFDTDRAAPAGPVVDDGVLTPGVREHLSDGACHHVAAGPGRRRDDQPDRSRRIIGWFALRQRRPAISEHGTQQPACNDPVYALHERLPPEDCMMRRRVMQERNQFPISDRSATMRFRSAGRKA